MRWIEQPSTRRRRFCRFKTRTDGFPNHRHSRGSEMTSTIWHQIQRQVVTFQWPSARSEWLALLFLSHRSSGTQPWLHGSDLNSMVRLPSFERLLMAILELVDGTFVSNLHWGEEPPTDLKPRRKMKIYQRCKTMGNTTVFLGPGLQLVAWSWLT